MGGIRCVKLPPISLAGYYELTLEIIQVDLAQCHTVAERLLGRSGRTSALKAAASTVECLW